MAEPNPIRGIGIANFRSFDSDGVILRNLSKTNVLIGKNNAGKSNILRALQLLAAIKSSTANLGLDPTRDGHKRNTTAPSATLLLDPNIIIKDPKVAAQYNLHSQDPILVRWNLSTGIVENRDPFTGLDHSFFHRFIRQFGHQFNEYLPPEKYWPFFHTHLVEIGIASLKLLRNNLYIPAFRELREGQRPASPDSFDGAQVISTLHDMQHPVPGEERARTTFDHIQRFVRDLIGDTQLELEIPPSKNEIVISHNGHRMRLDSFGSGMHQLVLICAALAMYENRYVFLEEPETHMHPELQRRLLQFISDRTSNTYFITTHSNIFLDFRPEIGIYHVRNDGMCTTIEDCSTSKPAREILDDMGYRASDMLQANGVIWVEGPSDRIYLNTWLRLVDPSLIEGIHYGVAFYGGKVLAHFSAVDDPIDDLLKVLRINRNAFFIMDRDAAVNGAKLGEHKSRIIEEIGKDGFWVTEGREIENYLGVELLERYIESRSKKKVKVNLKPDGKIEDSLRSAAKRAGIRKLRYNDSKPAFAREICELICESDLQTLDLRIRVTHLANLIRIWNGMSIEPPQQ